MTVLNSSDEHSVGAASFRAIAVAFAIPTLLLTPLLLIGPSRGVGGFGTEDRVEIIATKTLFCILAPLRHSVFWWMRWDQAIASIADQIRPSGAAKCLATLKIIFGFKELHQGPLHLAFFHRFSNVNGLFREWIHLGEVHRRCDVQQRWNEILNCVRFITISF